jgi:hypothetical protein
MHAAKYDTPPHSPTAKYPKPHQININSPPTQPSSLVYPGCRAPPAEIGLAGISGLFVGKVQVPPLVYPAFPPPKLPPPALFVNVTTVVTGCKMLVLPWITTAVPLWSKLSVVPSTVIASPPGLSTVPGLIVM